MRDSAFQTMTIRLLPQEDSIIDKACTAMKKIDRSTLMTTAAVFHAQRLGIDFSYEPRRRSRSPGPTFRRGAMRRLGFGSPSRSTLGPKS